VAAVLQICVGREKSHREEMDGGGPKMLFGAKDLPMGS